MRTLRAVGLLTAGALLAAGCAADTDTAARTEGDCAARLRVDDIVLDPVGARPAGRRGDPVTADVVGCDEELVDEVEARPVVRSGETLGHEVAGGTYRGFYSTDSVVGPTG